MASLNAQASEIVSEEAGPDGETGYGHRGTDRNGRDLDLTDQVPQRSEYRTDENSCNGRSGLRSHTRTLSLCPRVLVLTKGTHLGWKAQRVQ